MNHEYNLLREKQELRQAQAEILKAKEQEQKENTEKARQDEQAEDDQELKNKQKLKQQQRLAFKKRQESLNAEQSSFNTHKAIDVFLSNGDKKKMGEGDDIGEHHMATTLEKRYFNKNPAEGLVGRPDKRSKEVIIFSKKSVEGSINDMATVQKKVAVKDLLEVLKSDPRLAHKPLVYQLQNRV